MEDTRVLIIDDSEDIHSRLRGLFPSQRKLSPAPNLNLIFDSAVQGEIGYQMVSRSLERQKPYALAIIDRSMPPGWDGLHTIKKIRELDQDIEIILCSSHTDSSWHHVSQELGFSDKLLFLTKPYDVLEMEQMIAHLVGKWHLSRQFQTLSKDLHKAQEIAEQSQAAKYEFLGTMGHELRTPLNLILLTLEDLLVNLQDQDTLAIIRGTHKSSQQLAQLIDDILTFSALDRGDFGFEEQTFKLLTIIANCQAKYDPLCQDKGLTFTTNVPSTLPLSFIGDKKQTARLVDLLLSNAIKFTDSGSIKLTVRIDEEFSKHTPLNTLALQFIIKDTGRGMDADQLSRCFDLFYRGNNVGGSRGPGLGLHLCKKIVLAMGGSLGIDSAPQQGTIAWFTLPIKADHGQHSGSNVWGTAS